MVDNTFTLTRHIKHNSWNPRTVTALQLFAWFMRWKMAPSNSKNRFNSANIQNYRDNFSESSQQKIWSRSIFSSSWLNWTLHSVPIKRYWQKKKSSLWNKVADKICYAGLLLAWEKTCCFSTKWVNLQYDIHNGVNPLWLPFHCLPNFYKMAPSNLKKTVLQKYKCL